MKTQLLVLAAGMGSRFGGVKQVEGVGPRGETVLEYSVYDALEAGFDEIVFLIRRSIEADFRRTVIARLPARVSWTLAFQETDTLLSRRDLAASSGRRKPWGTGHALLCAASKLDSPFAVINADDAYGKEAFALVHAHLSGRGAAEGPGESVTDCCMAGYALQNVTSEFGPVSRGVCSLGPDGYLASVVEHVSISREPGGAGFVSSDPQGGRTGLPGDTLVSMNLWGMGPEILPMAEGLFRGFLEARRSSQDAEFYLPSILDSLAREGRVRVKVLPTREKPFGLTYRGDIASTRGLIADAVARGEYPDPLWRDRSADGLGTLWSRRGMPELYDMGATGHARLFAGAEYPWDAIPRIEAYILGLLDSLPEEGADGGKDGGADNVILSTVPPGVTIEGRVHIGPGCRIEPGAFIRGPAWIGEGCEIRQGAYLRGAVLAGAGAVLGHSSEFKNCVLLEGAQAPHFNYVGDSILGTGAHIGAGVILSNFRLDHGPVTVRSGLVGQDGEIRAWETGLPKFGALIGDHCEIGCNSVLNPGTVLGARSVALPLARIKGLHPEGTKLG